MHQKFKFFLFFYCLAVILLNIFQMTAIKKCEKTNPQVLINIRWYINMSMISIFSLLATLIVYYGMFKECNAKLFESYQQRKEEYMNPKQNAGGIGWALGGDNVQTKLTNYQTAKNAVNKTHISVLLFCILIGITQLVLHSLLIFEFKKCKDVDLGNYELYSSFGGITLSIVEVLLCGFMMK